jgi:hypothetical protein
MIQRDPEIIGAEAGEDLVMVSIETGHYYGVSKIGKEIWRMIESPVTVSDLINDLMTTFAVDRACCEEQTLAFLEELLAEGLLQVKHASTS